MSTNKSKKKMYKPTLLDMLLILEETQFMLVKGLDKIGYYWQSKENCNENSPLYEAMSKIRAAESNIAGLRRGLVHEINNKLQGDENNGR